MSDTPLADIVRRLSAEGVSADVIADVVACAERHAKPASVTIDSQAERRRAADRARKQQERDAKKSADNPQTSADTKAKKSPPKNNIQTPTKKIPPECPPDAFEQFYEAYPKKAAKRRAAAAFKAALKRTDFKTIMAGLARYSPEPAFTKHPATWLNGDCWADEPKTSSNVVQLDAETLERAKARVFVAEDSPQFEAWTAYLRSRGKAPPPSKWSAEHNANGWWFETEWPPQARERVAK